MRFIIIGGGAAGVFASIAAQECDVVLLEKSAKLLSKVKVSGGGRCNVTHSCFDPKELVRNYPRGARELLGPFHRFGPRDTIAWFAERGVELKTESDGRMFPVTDSSTTIMDCLLNDARRQGVEILRRQNVERIERLAEGFRIHREGEPPLDCDRLLLAMGSSPAGHEFARSLGHTVQPSVPSLFTFNLPNSPICELAGISVENAELTLVHPAMTHKGPMLITHWGLSGPAALRLSAWAARELHACNYRADLSVDWIPGKDPEAMLRQQRQTSPTRTLSGLTDVGLPRKLWLYLVERAGVPLTQRLAELRGDQQRALCGVLKADRYRSDGKTTHKEEFVTCGGVTLSEVDFRTMESRICPGLFFAGEILDIDGITGGFNFQNAWTTGWIAGRAASACLIFAALSF